MCLSVRPFFTPSKQDEIPSSISLIIRRNPRPHTIKNHIPIQNRLIQIRHITPRRVHNARRHTIRSQFVNVIDRTTVGSSVSIDFKINTRTWTDGGVGAGGTVDGCVVVGVFGAVDEGRALGACVGAELFDGFEVL